HVGLRLYQQDFIFSDPASAGERLTVPVVHHRASIFGQPVNRQKTDVVRRELILDTGIAQTDDQLHAAYFSFAAGSAPSSSASCLPFLMTSGSAGAAAAASAAASGVGATSSFTDVMCATAWSSSVINFSLPPVLGRSFTRVTAPKTSSETSTSMWVGMS